MIIQSLKSSVIVLACISFFVTSKAQTQLENPIPFQLPQSPNAASIARYGNTPVNLNSGQISPSIDIYKIEIDGLSLPISMTYNNTGLKVDEIPSWVGHGWDLQSGGLLIHSVRGLPDECPVGMLRYGIREYVKKAVNNQMTAMQRFIYYRDVFEGVVDSEYDQYSYQYPGGSGSFFINSQGQCITQPRADIKISYTFDSVSNSIGNFSILDNLGNKYEFSTAESSSSEDLANSIFSNFYNTYSSSSFFLTKVITSNGRVVNFQYKSNTFSYVDEHQVYQSFTSNDHPFCAGRNSSLTINQMKITQATKLLELISWDGGRIEFFSDSIRKDLRKLDTSIHSPMLNRIKVFSSDNKLIKNVDFTYGYFGSENRLKLSAINFKDVISGDTAMQYNFTYYSENNVPSLSKPNRSQDLWGYYNGAFNQILPKVDLLQKYYVRPQSTGFVSPNRISNGNAKFGMLKEIVYPTGGKTLFEYESNKIMFPRLSDVPIAMREQLGMETLIPIIDTTADSNSATAGGAYVNHDINFSFTLTDSTRLYVEAIYFNDDPTFFGQSEGWINLTCMEAEGYSCITSNEWQYGRTVTANYLVPPGTYSGYVSTSAQDNHWAWAVLRVSKYPSAKNIVVDVGGFRVNKVSDFDSLGNVYPKTFTYPLDTSNRSYNSILRIAPQLVVTTTPAVPGPNNPSLCVECAPTYTVHSFDVKNFDGFHVEYPKVVEFLSNKDSIGRIEHFFSQPQQIGGGSFPYAKPMYFSWLGGKEVNTRTFNGPQGLDTAQLIERVDKSYSVNNNYSDSTAYSLKVGVDHANPCLGYPGMPNTENGANYALGSFTADFIPLTTQKFNESNSTTESRYYYPNGTYSSVTKSYSLVYNNNSQTLPSMIMMVDSKGDTSRKYVKYPFDYSTSNPTVDSLVKKNRIALPIEQFQTIKRVAGTEKVVASRFTLFADGKVLPQKEYTLELFEPLAINSFTQSSVISGNFVKDSRYKEKYHFSGYDRFGNIRTLIKDGSDKSAAIWDYNSLYQVATITNADSSEVAYSSFEADGKGNWSNNTGTVTTVGSAPFPPTGKKYYSLTSALPLTKSVTVGKAYVVSYWRYNSSIPFAILGGSGTGKKGETINNWTHFKHVVTAVSSFIRIAGTGGIDEVRLHPANAKMITYTYDPLVGMTSQCDSNHQIVYYEYDGMGRLKAQRDKDGSLLRTYDYQFRQKYNQ